MRLLVVGLILAISITRPATACPETGRPSSFPTFPEPSAPERPLPFQKEAVQKAVFDNCFLAGTLVVAGQDSGSGRIERFMKPVQEVRAGDQVLAQDPVTGEVGYRRVVRTFENVATSVVSVTVGAPECLPLRQAGRTERHAVGQAGSGEEGGEDAEPPSASQTIRCTPGHPWRVRDADGGLRWVFAGDLRVGDLLVPEAGPEQVVLALDVRAEVARTFNFEVEGWHTYYVSGEAGQPGVLVHNRSGAAAAAKRILARIRRMKRNMTEGEKGFTTFAAAEVRVGKRTETWVSAAGSKGFVPPRVRGRAEQIIHPGRSSAQHLPHINDAERALIREARRRGAKIVAIGATRAMCPHCIAALSKTGSAAARATH